jgi:fused signal recognition particle receptor
MLSELMVVVFIVGIAGAATLGVYLRRRSQSKRTASLKTPLTLGLAKTRKNFLGRLEQLIGRSDAFNDALFAELEELLIGADVGVATTGKLLAALRNDARAGNADPSLLKKYLTEEIYRILSLPSKHTEPPSHTRVMMIVGVNGVGKTTSIGKLIHRYRREGNKILLAAADTFRAGAVDQLRVWGERVGAETVTQQEGADPAAVAFDAVKSGVARGMDRVVIDTAGRLHTKVNLMEELKKVKRVIDKALPHAPHETLLVIDATQGQNAVHQAREFHQALGLTGIILTKLDSTSKGGIVVAVVDELQVPIRYVGVGEKLEDLQPFDARGFVDALLA